MNIGERGKVTVGADIQFSSFGNRRLGITLFKVRKKENKQDHGRELCGELWFEGQLGYVSFNGWLNIKHEPQSRDLAYSFLVSEIIQVIQEDCAAREGRRFALYLYQRRI